MVVDTLVNFGLSLTLSVPTCIWVKNHIFDREINKVKEKFYNILLNSNIQGIRTKEGETFHVKKVQKIENGYKLIVFVKDGLAVDSLKSAKNQLEDAFNAIVDVSKERYKSSVQVIIVNKKPNFNFRPVKVNAPNKIFLGFNLLGEEYILDLAKNPPHILIAGMSGTGKSFLLASIITNIAYNHPNLTELYLLQIKKGDISYFKDLKNTKFCGKTLSECSVVLEKLDKIIDKRVKIFEKENNIRDIEQYNKIFPKNKMKYIYIVIEEMSFFMPSDISNDEENDLKKKCWDRLFSIVKSARSTGIHLLSLVQRTTTNNLPSDVKSQMCTVSFKQKSSIDSTNAIGTNEAVRLESREMIFDGSDYCKLIAPSIDKEYKNLKKYVPEIVIPDNNKKLNNDNLDLFELTNKLRCTEKRENKDLNNVIQIKKSKEANKEVASGSITSIDSEGKFDKEILRFIEEFKCITVNQCSRMFYKNIESSRRRLNQLVDKGALSSFQNTRNREKVYYINTKLSAHNILIRDFISKLIENGATINKINISCSYLKDLIRPDAYINYKYNNKEYTVLLEVDYTHMTDSNKIKLYEKMINDRVIEPFTVAIMRNSTVCPKLTSKIVRIRNFDFKLNIDLPGAITN